MNHLNEHLVTFLRIEPGNRGYYIVTYPYEEDLSEEIEGSITVDLDCCEVLNLKRGVTLVAKDLYHKPGGWQAERIIRKATPTDLARSRKNKKKENER